MVARPISWVVRLLIPVLVTIEALVRLILRLVGIRVGETQSILSPHEEIRGTVDLLHREGGVDKLDRDMVGGLLDLRDLEVGDVMVHRTAMMTLNADDPTEEIVRAMLASEYTRVPLWRESPENIIGILHAKDLLRAIRDAEDDLSKVDVTAIALPSWFVPNFRPLTEQLKAFRRRKTHFALVVDEYGDLMGMVTLEDILEEIVGDISDEQDMPVPGVRPQPDGSVNVDGAVPVRDLNRVMDWNLPDNEATTIAGLVIHEARSIPEVGQSFTFHGFRFRVQRKHRNRITALRITPLVPKADGGKGRMRKFMRVFTIAMMLAAGFVAGGTGAKLSRPSDPSHRAVPGRRFGRRARAFGRRRDQQDARPAGHRRKSCRRGRQRGRRCGRQGRARWLHAADVVGGHSHGQSVPLHDNAVRRGDRFHSRSPTSPTCR